MRILKIIYNFIKKKVGNSPSEYIADIGEYLKK